MQSVSSSKGGGQGVLGLIAIVCIGVAVFFIVKQAKKKEEVTTGDVYYYCTSCQKEFADSSDKVPPIKCPNCGKVTAAYLRKCKCSECGTVFRGYLLQWDPETKRLKERRKRGEYVSHEGEENDLVSRPDEEDWVNSSTPEGLDIINNIVCPECEASGEVIEPVFPKTREKK